MRWIEKTKLTRAGPQINVRLRQDLKATFSILPVIIFSGGNVMRSESEYPKASAKGHGVRKAVFTSVIGQILEWYDFFLYGTAAALIFGKIFFPVGEDPLTHPIAHIFFRVENQQLTSASDTLGS